MEQQVIRQIVDRKNITSVFIPEDFGEFVELIVFPAKKEKKISAESKAMIKKNPWLLYFVTLFLTFSDQRFTLL